MNSISIRQGETLEINIVSEEETAESVELKVADDDGMLILVEEATFSEVDDKWVAVITSNDTNIPADTYKYQLEITSEGGVIDILPDPAECDDGDCELPKFIVCESLAGVS